MTTPETDGSLEAGSIIANNYRVTARLGAGGMGTVYLADNITLNQRVVVKVLRGGAQGAGQEEAQIMANLQHPNIVTVYAHDPSRDCIVMEYLDGASLSTLLEKGVDRINAIRVALAVAEALAAVHKRGLVHRDIKPENVMLALNSGGGRLVDWLKLIDFGLALKVGKKPEVLLGTPEYCGPEQFLAEEGASPANDVYALGVTIYLMMTGAFPFDGPREGLPLLHSTQPPPNLVEALVTRFGKDSFDPRTLALLEDLDELLQQMLAKATADRPTAQEVARRLIRLESSFAEAGTYVGAPAPAIAPVAQGSGGRRRSGTGVLAKVKKEDSSATAPEVEVVTTKRRVASPETSSIELQQPPRSNGGLIVGLVGVVMALLAAVVFTFIGGSPAPVVEPEPEVKAPEVKAPVVEPPKVVVAPVPVVDAGTHDAAVPAEMDELSALGVIKKPKPVVVAAVKPPKPPACKYDDAFAQAARQTLTQLGRGVSRVKQDQLEDLGEDMAGAFKAKDCKGVEEVLRKMRAVVAAP